MRDLNLLIAETTDGVSSRVLHVDSELAAAAWLLLDLIP